jgi:hypothetical protein
MEFINSHRTLSGRTATEMVNDYFYNMWAIRKWPYREVLAGDVLYVYESTSQRIMWKAAIKFVERFSYLRKRDAASTFQRIFGDFNTSDYFEKAPNKGYCLVWTLKRSVRVNLPKPLGLRFPQEGWLRVNEHIARRWVAKTHIEDEADLDGLIPDRQGPIRSESDLFERLRLLSQRMAEVQGERVRKLVEQADRRDRGIVRALKEFRQFRCQFPGCGASILKADGTFYIEVAHVSPYHGGGSSVLPNLLVLCPNHHKEWDYGHLQIVKSNKGTVGGLLNGRPFLIPVKSA